MEAHTDIVGRQMDGVNGHTVTRRSRRCVGTGVHHAHVLTRSLGRSLLIEVEGYVDVDRTLTETEQSGGMAHRVVVAAIPNATLGDAPHRPWSEHTAF